MNIKEINQNKTKGFLTFLKIGLIGFGGGSALIPVFENELVKNKRLLDKEEFIKHTVVANITPGALPVKLGATCGYKTSGVRGSLAGAYSVMFPGVFITILLMMMFSLLGSNIINYFNYASVGISAFIIFLLLSYIKKIVSGERWRLNILLCIGGFILTGGHELRELLAGSFNLEVGKTSLFDISSINMMIIAFFMIILIVINNSEIAISLGIVQSLAFAFLSGSLAKSKGYDSYSSIILLLMVATILTFAIISKKKGGNLKSQYKLKIEKGILITVALFIFIPIVLLALILILANDGGVVDFILKIAASTVTSFGGGEAYLSVADGIFVKGEYISSDLFYTRLVPVANALPGPILIKIAAGIGYTIGAQHSYISGWLIAILVAMVTVGLCSSIAMIVMSLYDNIKDSKFIIGIKNNILPVICGMLISTSCSMLIESSKILRDKGIGFNASVITIAVWIALMFAVTAKKQIKDIYLILISAAMSLVVLTLIH